MSERRRLHTQDINQRNLHQPLRLAAAYSSPSALCSEATRNHRFLEDQFPSVYWRGSKMRKPLRSRKRPLPIGRLGAWLLPSALMSGVALNRPHDHITEGTDYPFPRRRPSLDLSAGDKVVEYLRALQEKHEVSNTPGRARGGASRMRFTLKPRISKIRLKTLNENLDFSLIPLDKITLEQGLRELIKEGFLEGREEDGALCYVSVTHKGEKEKKLIV